MTATVLKHPWQVVRKKNTTKIEKTSRLTAWEGLAATSRNNTEYARYSTICTPSRVLVHVQIENDTASYEGENDI